MIHEAQGQVTVNLGDLTVARVFLEPRKDAAISGTGRIVDSVALAQPMVGRLSDGDAHARTARVGGGSLGCGRGLLEV